MDPVQLALQLCAIPSCSGEESALVNHLERLLMGMGLSVKRQPLGNNGQANLLAYAGVRMPDILLSTHLDTVPPFIPPKEDGEWLYGRGVCDAKGIMASMICAVKNLHAYGENRVGLLFLAEEETNSSGAKAAVNGFAPNIRYIINGEPTDLKVASAMKGALVFELCAEGRPGHSAYPESGHSALHQLIGDCERILRYPWPSNTGFGQTTVNIGFLQGGVAGNVIAGEARALAVMRLSQDTAMFKTLLKELVDPKTYLRICSESNPRQLHVPKGWSSCVVSFGSDIPHLEQLGIPILFGPGSILDAHTQMEKIRKQDILLASKLYEKMCIQLL